MNILNHKTRLLKAAICASLLGCTLSATSACAVELSQIPSGQALVLPFWATTGDHTTVMSVAPAGVEFGQSTSQPSVATFRLFDQEGEEVFSALLYFSNAYDAWQFGIGGVDASSSTLSNLDADTCVLTGSAGGLAVMTGSETLPATYGYASVISAGAVTDESVATMIRGHDCTGLATRWNSGTWSSDPSAGLTVGGAVQADTLMVNVARGTLYHIPATALTRFSDIVQHQPPGSGLPNLGSAHDAGTDSDSTTGRRCISGTCTEDSFTTPLGAVHYALTIDSISADFSTLPALGARSEMVLASPLARLAQQANLFSEYGHPYPVITWRFTNTNGATIASTAFPEVVPSVIPPDGIQYGFSLSAVSVLAIWRPEEVAANDYSGELSGATTVPAGNDESNDFYPHFVDELDPLTSYSGQVVVTPYGVLGGESLSDKAIIGVMLTQYINSSLVEQGGEQVRANYSQAVAMKRGVVGD